MPKENQKTGPQWAGSAGVKDVCCNEWSDSFAEISFQLLLYNLLQPLHFYTEGGGGGGGNFANMVQDIHSYSGFSVSSSS